ncbi:MAG TPA: hypothetical protein V6C86_23980 [Oculatellaceae cyanobacterium]
MKRNKAVKSKPVTAEEIEKQHFVAQRLDESIPLQTDEWEKVEQMLMRLTEFAPAALIEDVVAAMASYADDQARRGYLLGQEDLMKHLMKRVA